MVKAGGYDLGLAFDGDADRCLAVDETGEIMDGDKIMAICGQALQAEEKLTGNAIVATVMSNLGLHVFARDHGIRLLCSDVGDRNVLEAMLREGYVLGGEQSGHMIFLKHATTGDGQLAALQLLQILSRSGRKASELSAECGQYPQVLVNVAVKDNEQKGFVMASQPLKELIAEEEKALTGDGRILVRPSGTEALVRVMVEAKEIATAQSCAQKLADYIKNLCAGERC